MKTKYIKISKGFAESNNKKKRGLNAFSYNVTTSGDYFCSVNLLDTHPDLFVNMNIEYIWVGQEDLPIADDLITPTRSRFRLFGGSKGENKSSSTEIKLNWFQRLINWIKKQFK